MFSPPPHLKLGIYTRTNYFIVFLIIWAPKIILTRPLLSATCILQVYLVSLNLNCTETIRSF